MILCKKRGLQTTFRLPHVLIKFTSMNLAQCQKMLQDFLPIIKDETKHCKGQAVVDLRCALQCADQASCLKRTLTRLRASLIWLAVLLFIDVLTKQLALDIQGTITLFSGLALTRVHNHGVAFGLLAGLGIWFHALTLLVFHGHTFWHSHRASTKFV